METKTVARRALVWDPYLDTLGGGERYALSVARFLADAGYHTVLVWSDKNIMAEAQRRFGLKLDDISLDTEHFNLLFHKSPLGERKKFMRTFEIIFWVSDGSIPTLFGKTNLLHYQVPFKHINGSRISNWLKLRRVKTVVVNSRFTQKIISRSLHSRKSLVLYPPVELITADDVKHKQPVILNVGRFVSPSHPKRQDVLIDAFRILVANKPAQNWRLILAGGHRGDHASLSVLKLAARDLPVEFAVNPNFAALQQLYRQASIYWHAAGFEVDESKHPEAVEHFGITTVEAMSAQAVPVVINKGGQREIVTPASGILCNSVADLVASTLDLISQPQKLSQLAAGARVRAQDFSQAVFAAKFLEIVK